MGKEQEQIKDAFIAGFICADGDVNEAKSQSNQYLSCISYDEKDKRCNNCRYWNNGDSQERGECDANNYGDELDQYQTLDAYSIYTGPDFGCIHWEGK